MLSRQNLECALEVKNQIARHRELRLAGGAVIGLAVPRMVKANLRANLDCRTDPMAKHKCVLGVPGVYAGPLTLFVVEQIAAKRDKVVRRELSIEVVGYGVFGCKAKLHSWSAGSAGCTLFGSDRTEDTGHIAFIH